MWISDVDKTVLFYSIDDILVRSEIQWWCGQITREIGEC